MAYSITIENDVMRIELSGRLTGQDLDACCAEMMQHEQQSAIVPPRITDATGVTEMAIHYPHISALAEKRRQTRFQNAFKSAIIAPNSDQLGYARMFQTLNDNPQITIRIFRDEASANHWIAGPQ